MEGRRHLAQAAACGCDGRSERVRPDVPVKAPPARPEQRSARCPASSSAAPAARGWAWPWAGLTLGLGSVLSLSLAKTWWWGGKRSSASPCVSLPSAVGRAAAGMAPAERGAVAKMTPAERGHLKEGFKVNCSPGPSPGRPVPVARALDATGRPVLRGGFGDTWNGAPRVRQQVPGDPSESSLKLS